MSDHTHRNINTLRTIYANLSCIGDYVTDSVVLHPATRGIAGGPDKVIGKQAVVDWECGLIAASGGQLDMDVQHIVANGHFGTVLGILRSTFSGCEFAQPFCGVWRFEDGRITEHWENIYAPTQLASLTHDSERQEESP